MNGVAHGLFLRSVFAGMFSAALLSGPVFASGGHSSGSTGAGASETTAMPSQPADTDDMTTCPKRQMWDSKHKRCVTMRKGALSDDETADYAYALAKAARYPEAIEVLDLMHNANTAEALNYRGYATRKMGRTEEGVGYYLRSIALDPKYPKVREYLGEAYVIQGRTDLAKEQLGVIKTLCGTDCEPYRDLSDAIGKAKPL
jgi:tetratricopeptide (TPR) repeat protein